MGQILEARTIEKEPYPNQVQQLKVAIQLLRNMGFFLSGFFEKKNGDFTDNSTVYIELTTTQKGIPPVKATLRLKGSSASSEPFKYTVINKETRDTLPSFGSVFFDGRHIRKILQAYIHPAMHADLNFGQDEKTNFAILQIPQSRFDSHAVVLGNNRVIGLEFRPQIPSDRDIPSTQHGKVALIYLPKEL